MTYINLDIRILHTLMYQVDLCYTDTVHQVCAGGNNNQKQLGVFTDEGCIFFPHDTCWDALKLLSNKKQAFYGLAHNGVYLYSPDANSKSI